MIKGSALFFLMSLAIHSSAHKDSVDVDGTAQPFRPAIGAVPDLMLLERSRFKVGVPPYSCPQGYSYVKKEHECDAAASALGKMYRGSEYYAQGPPGCFTDTYNNIVFNGHMHSPSMTGSNLPICEAPAKECASGPQQCAHLASFSLLDEVAAFRNDQEARTCMNSGMASVTRQVANTCTLRQVQGSIPCGTECWPVLRPKILNVQSWCLKKKYSGLEKYNKCLLEHSCDRPSAKQCRDTDHGHSDSGGDPCYRYHGHESWCGHYDTGHPPFYSIEMCCACGGGDWACPDQSATDVMKVQGAANVMEGYLSNISLQLSQTSPEPPIPMTHANHETLSLTLAFIGGALTAIMIGVIAMRRLQGKRNSAAWHLLA